jgi:hypothetical protein
VIDAMTASRRMHSMHDEQQARTHSKTVRQQQQKRKIKKHKNIRKHKKSAAKLRGNSTIRPRSNCFFTRVRQGERELCDGQHRALTLVGLWERQGLSKIGTDSNGMKRQLQYSMFYIKPPKKRNRLLLHSMYPTTKARRSQ